MDLSSGAIDTLFLSSPQLPHLSSDDSNSNRLHDCLESKCVYTCYLPTLLLSGNAANLWHSQFYISFEDKFHRDPYWVVHGHTAVKRNYSNPSILIPNPVVFNISTTFALSDEGTQSEGKISVWWGKAWRASWKRCLREGLGGRHSREGAGDERH